MTVQEYRRKCKVCGKIWCYTAEDLNASLANSTAGLISSVASLANLAVGGPKYTTFELQKSADRNINKLQDFTICPECHSRDNEPYYTEEDRLRIAEEEKRAAEEAKHKAEEERRAAEARGSSHGHCHPKDQQGSCQRLIWNCAPAISSSILPCPSGGRGKSSPWMTARLWCASGTTSSARWPSPSSPSPKLANARNR